MLVVEKVESILTDRIFSGMYRHGEKIPSLRELSQELEASYVIVFRAVDAMKNKGLLESRKGSGVFVRKSSPSPVSVSARQIAFIFADPADNPQEEYQLEVYTYMQPMLRERGYIDVAFRFNETMLPEPKKIAGVIAMGQSPMQPFLRKNRIPVVYCCTNGNESPFSSVSPDLYQGSYAVTEHLIRSGHRRIGLISTADPQSRKNFVLRCAGYADAVRDYGLTAYEPLAWNIHSSAARQQLEALVRGDGAPTAFFAGNDIMAVEILHAVREMNLRVPGDISVAGLEDMRCSAQSVPPLTTASYSKRQLAEETVGVLENLIARRETGAVDKKIPMVLTVRGSVTNMDGTLSVK